MKSHRLLRILSMGLAFFLLVGCLAQSPAAPTRLAPTQAAATVIAPSSTPRPTITSPTTPSSFSGSVSIEGGKCCAGGTAGKTIQVEAEFSAASPSGQVSQMRVLPGYGGCANAANLDAASWEPFTPSRAYPVAVAINWSTFHISAQFQDAQGNLSSVYCAEIAVEGAPPVPAVNPSEWYPQVQCFAENEVHPAQGETVTDTPVTFSWPNKNSLPEGVFYKVFAFGAGDSYTASVASGETRESAIPLPIPPDRAGDIVWYVVLVDANGTLLDHGKCSSFGASLLNVDPPSGIKGVHFMYQP